MQELSARDERTVAFARSELTRVLRAMSLRDLSRHVRLDLVLKPDTQPLRGLQREPALLQLMSAAALYTRPLWPGEEQALR